MRISEMLTAIASWLESPDNEALLLSEYDDQCIDIVANSCVEAAAILRKAANEVDVIEPPDASNLTDSSIEELGNVASAFDLSGDEKLQKMASVIDELLLTIAAPPKSDSDKNAEDTRLEDLRRKYQDPREALDDMNKISDSEKAIKDSPMSKEYRILEAPLSIRGCPDHPGAQVARVGEHTWQCALDKKIYNYDTGFTLNNGSKVPGGGVEGQSAVQRQESHAIFDSRESRLQGFNQ